MIFKEQFPSLKKAEFIEIAKCNYDGSKKETFSFDEDIRSIPEYIKIPKEWFLKYCRDEQKVWEAINKLRNMRCTGKCDLAQGLQVECCDDISAQSLLEELEL